MFLVLLALRVPLVRQVRQAQLVLMALRALPAQQEPQELLVRLVLRVRQGLLSRWTPSLPS